MQEQTMTTELFRKAAKDAHLSTRIRFEYENVGADPSPADPLETGPTPLTRIEGDCAITKRDLREVRAYFVNALRIRALDDKRCSEPRRRITVTVEVTAESPDDRIARIDRYCITVLRRQSIESSLTRHLLVFAAQYDAHCEIALRVDGIPSTGIVTPDAKTSDWPGLLSPETEQPQQEKPTMNDIENNSYEKEAYMLPEDYEATRAVQSDMLCAARTARKMGLFVTPMKEGTRKTQAYMIIGPKGPVMRVSDHDVAWTPERDYLSGGDGFDGRCHVYASNNPRRRPAWWRRAFTLVMSGREVPGKGVPTRPALA